ncbi:MAG TPA: stage III sporulation protein AE [Clostridia bacterium]|nr:stage III sporulation protein AE [Clostridia bacterium]
MNKNIHNTSFLNKYKIIAVLCLLLLLAAFFFPTDVFADDDELTELTEEQGNAIDWDELEDFLESLETGDFQDKSLFEIFSGLIHGEYTVGSGDFSQYVFQIFFSRLASSLPSILTIVAVAALCGLLAKNKSNIFGKSTGELIFFVCFSVIIVTTLAYVWSYVEATKKALTQMKTLINLVMPTLLAFMSAIGSKVAVAVYQPSVALLANGIIEIACNVIMPLIIISFVFSVISNLSNDVRLDKITTFFKNFAMAIFGISFTIFSAFLSVQGINANVFDSISLRAAKYATKNYIPIVGGYLAEGLDLVLASSILVKNAFGVVALLMLAAVIVFPVMELVVFNLLMQLAAGIIEPITDERIVKFLTSVSKNLMLLVVLILGVALMFFIVILLVISTANVF